MLLMAARVVEKWLQQAVLMRVACMACPCSRGKGPFGAGGRSMLTVQSDYSALVEALSGTGSGGSGALVVAGAAAGMGGGGARAAHALGAGPGSCSPLPQAAAHAGLAELGVAGPEGLITLFKTAWGRVKSLGVQLGNPGPDAASFAAALATDPGFLEALQHPRACKYFVATTPVVRTCVRAHVGMQIA